MPVLGPDTQLARAPRCAGRVIEGRAAVVTPHDNRLHLLNATGTAIWRRLTNQNASRPLSQASSETGASAANLPLATVEELAKAVVDEFETTIEQARADVTLFCEDLIARKVLVIVGEGQSQ